MVHTTYIRKRREGRKGKKQQTKREENERKTKENETKTKENERKRKKTKTKTNFALRAQAESGGDNVAVCWYDQPYDLSSSWTNRRTAR